MRDTIYRDEAIEAVCGVVIDEFDVSPTKGYEVSEHALSALPSAEPDPTVIRSRTFMPTKDFKEWAERIRDVNPNAVVIPCDAEVVSAEAEEHRIYKDGYNTGKAHASAEAVQGWIPVEEQPPVFPCLVCDAHGNQPSVPLGIVTITDEEHGEWHIDGRLWDTKIFFEGEWCSQTGYGNRIIAWMPLPEPYKGGDSE